MADNFNFERDHFRHDSNSNRSKANKSKPSSYPIDQKAFRPNGFVQVDSTFHTLNLIPQAQPNPQTQTDLKGLFIPASLVLLI